MWASKVIVYCIIWDDFSGWNRLKQYECMPSISTQTVEVPVHSVHTLHTQSHTCEVLYACECCCLH